MVSQHFCNLNLMVGAFQEVFTIKSPLWFSHSVPPSCTTGPRPSAFLGGHAREGSLGVLKGTILLEIDEGVILQNFPLYRGPSILFPSSLQGHVQPRSYHLCGCHRGPGAQ